MHPFAAHLLQWFNTAKRPLPWRESPEPYRIWLSEIILQQTRVDQGLAYYYRFIEAYPTVHDLAAAEEEQVLKLWQGLGYYSRARNLLKAARQVVDEYDGVFPGSAKALEALTGVGPYTAAAIASIAFNEAVSVVDGNVLRVMARIHNYGKAVNKPDGQKAIREMMDAYLPKTHPGDYNQAVMELGALICSPRSPKCGECPVNRFCAAFREGTAAELPVKEKRTKVRNVFYDYAVFVHDNHIILRFRAEKGIWNNLYDFPCIESEHDPGIEKRTAELLNTFDAEGELREVMGPVTHILSHRRISARFFIFNLARPLEIQNDHFRAAPQEDIGQYPVPRLVEKFLSQYRSDDLFN